MNGQEQKKKRQAPSAHCVQSPNGRGQGASICLASARRLVMQWQASAVEWYRACRTSATLARPSQRSRLGTSLEAIGRPAFPHIFPSMACFCPAAVIGSSPDAGSLKRMGNILMQPLLIAFGRKRIISMFFAHLWHMRLPHAMALPLCRAARTRSCHLLRPHFLWFSCLRQLPNQENTAHMHPDPDPVQNL